MPTVLQYIIIYCVTRFLPIYDRTFEMEISFSRQTWQWSHTITKLQNNRERQRKHISNKQGTTETECQISSGITITFFSDKVVLSQFWTVGETKPQSCDVFWTLFHEQGAEWGKATRPSFKRILGTQQRGRLEQQVWELNRVWIN